MMTDQTEREMAFVVTSVFRASVNEPRDSKKGLSLHELVQLKQIDVMMVQETHSDECSNETDWKKEWEEEVILSHLSNSKGGVLPNSVFLRQILEDKRKGRLVVVKAKFELYTVRFSKCLQPKHGS